MEANEQMWASSAITLIFYMMIWFHLEILNHFEKAP